ncbi:MAG: STAS domain-containing protein [Jatrophihabitans sp.]|uniref:STAS domain-containing protein n=1 Tax=Jatrophihabitans sp. TaxID=1932789 RepID=UPI003F819F42
MTTIELDRTDARLAVVSPVGRLNMASAPQLTTAVADIVAGGTHQVVVDLARTDFIDSSGLGALVASLKRCRKAGGDLLLAAPQGQVLFALENTNLLKVFAPLDSVDQARAQG